MWGAIAAGAFKGFLGGRDQDARNRAENERRRQEYKRALEIRKRNWLQQRSVYGAKANKYNIDLTEIDLAANRGYAKTQETLNRKRQAALLANEKSFTKYAKNVLGKTAAAGMTGQSGARIAGRQEAMLTTQQALRLNQLVKAGEAAKSANEEIFRKAKAAKRQAYGTVMFTPVPSLAPNPPSMLSESGGGLRGALMGGLTSAISNWSPTPKTGLEGGGMKYDLGSGTGNDMWGFDSSLGMDFEEMDFNFEGLQF